MSREPLEEALFVDRGGFEPEPPSSPFVAVQRVVVRLLFDPVFVAAVYEDPKRALDGLDLDPALTAQLLRNDRRLWNADRLRRSRALKILLDEFKVASTLALLESRKLAFLDAFFSSPFFHGAVRDRSYMALAFAGYLDDALRAGRLRSPQLDCALKLEAAMARSRRLLREARRGRDALLRPLGGAKPGERWAVRAGVGAVLLPGGALALIQHVEKYLFEVSQVPALALCDDPPSPEPLPRLDDAAVEAYLLEPQPGGKVDLSGISPSFARVLQACARPLDAEALLRALAPHGIGRDDALDYAGQLLEAGVLRRLQVSADGAVREAEPA
jgi:hypothetical protein